MLDGIPVQEHGMAQEEGQYKLQTLDEHDVPAATDAAIKKLLCECFPADAAAFSVSRYWHGTAPAYSLLHWKDERPPSLKLRRAARRFPSGRGEAAQGSPGGVGRVAGHVGIVIREVRCGRTRATAGKPALVAGIQNLAVAHELRGRGLSQQLMTEAMTEAVRRSVPFGLLFCVPELERLYASLGWRRTDVSVTLIENGKRVPIPGKNIAMFKELAGKPFPRGDIDLQGMDW